MRARLFGEIFPRSSVDVFRHERLRERALRKQTGKAEFFLVLLHLAARLVQRVRYALAGTALLLGDLRKGKIAVEIQIGDLALMLGENGVVNIPQP